MSAKANLRSEISLDDSKFTTGMRRVQSTASQGSQRIKRKFQDVGRTFGRIGKRLGSLSAKLLKVGAATAGIVIAAGTVLAARELARGLKRVADLGGRLSDVAARTGLAAGEVLVFERALTEAGVASDQAGILLDRLTRRVQLAADAVAGGGSNSYSRALEAAGLSAEKLLSMNKLERFNAVGQALMGMTDEARKTQAAMELLDTGAGKLMALFGDQGGLERAKESLGLQAEILSENANKFDRISDLLAVAGQKFQGFFVGILGEVADPLLGVLEKWEQTDFAKIGVELGDKLKPFFERASKFGTDVIESLREGNFEEAMNKIASGMANAFVEAMVALSPKLFDIFVRILNGVVEGITDAVAPENSRIGKAMEEQTKGNPLTRQFRAWKAIIGGGDEQTDAEKIAAIRLRANTAQAQMGIGGRKVEPTSGGFDFASAFNEMIAQQAQTNATLATATSD